MVIEQSSRAKYLSIAFFAAGLVGASGCGSSDPAPTGTGGKTSGAGGQMMQASGGAPASGGAVQAGTGNAQGGAPGSGGAASSGGASISGGSNAMGGANATGGSAQAGGGLGGSTSTTGGASTAGAGGSSDGGAAAGGSAGSAGSAGSGGSAGKAGSGGMGGNANPGTCTASKPANSNASGSGTHKVTVETNSDNGIREGTIYRPADLGGEEKYPIVVWGNGACSQNGFSNTASMAELASHGYFVIADGTPNGSGSRSQTSDWISMGKPLVAYIDWAVAENDKPCSAYYQALDTTKIASNGFSCGGLMSEGAAVDPRITAWGITSSGLTSDDQNYYPKVHAPALVILGGTSDIAYNNGKRDFDRIGKRGILTLLFSKNIGHGGDLGNARGGDFTKIHLAWLNWQLKGDEGETGKGVLYGSSCSYCKDSAWEVSSANVQ